MSEAEAEVAATRSDTQMGPLVVSAILERLASTAGSLVRRLGLLALAQATREPVICSEGERARRGRESS